MRYAVVAKHTKQFAELEIPDFNLSWEYPISISLAKLQVAARDRLMGAIQIYIDTREEIPLPKFSANDLNEEYEATNYKAKMIRLAWPIALKIQAYNAWRQSHITEVGLARLTGLSKSGIRNIFKLDTNTEMRGIALVLDALEYKVEFTLSRKVGRPRP